VSKEADEISPASGPTSAPIAIRPAGPFDLALLAELHAACFAERWDPAALASLLAMPGALAFLASGPLGPAGDEPLGFVLLRAIAGEAEIISIGVRPEARRAGIGRRLLGAALAAAAAGGAERLFLEVAADNWQALGLYLSHDFTEVGRRPNYYQRNGGGMMALVLSKPILPREE
jgi:ribosomal-protein-alanine N-acetyltransferase